MAKEDIQMVTECIKDEVSKLNGFAVMVANAMGGMEDHQENVVPGHTTYAEALNKHLPAAHLSTLARS